MFATFIQFFVNCDALSNPGFQCYINKVLPTYQTVYNLTLATNQASVLEQESFTVHSTSM